MSSSLNNFLSTNAAVSSSDHLLLQSLLARLNLDDDLLLPSDSDSDSLDADTTTTTTEEKHRKLIAKEVSKLEKEFIKIVNSGKGMETLKPNSGQSVSIGEHNICVGVHDDDTGSEYRVWEWHGHVMFFDEEDGYNAEYVYGSYFEKVAVDKNNNKKKSKVKGEGNSGLRDLIGSGSGSGDEMIGTGRVVHRSSVTVGALGLAK